MSDSAAVESAAKHGVLPSTGRYLLTVACEAIAVTGAAAILEGVIKFLEWIHHKPLPSFIDDVPLYFALALFFLLLALSSVQHAVHMYRRYSEDLKESDKTNR